MSQIGSVVLDKHYKDAHNTFETTMNDFQKLESDFRVRMEGKTTKGLIGRVFGTFAWMAVFAVLLVVTFPLVPSILWYITLAVTGLLFIAMTIDNILNFSYYGRFDGYADKIGRLRKTVSEADANLKNDYEKFNAARDRKWNYEVEVEPSLLEKAKGIATAVHGIDSFKNGAIRKLKSVMFFATVVSATVLGAFSLIEFASDTIMDLFSSYVSDDLVNIALYIAMAIVTVANIIFAKLIWSKTGTDVNNITLFAIPLGTVAFLVFVAAVTAIIALVIGLLVVAFYILGFVVVGATLYGFTSGG